MNGKWRAMALPIDNIIPNAGQPRKTFTAGGLSSLTQSLRQTGQLSPVVVRPGPEAKCSKLGTSGSAKRRMFMPRDSPQASA